MKTLHFVYCSFSTVKGTSYLYVGFKNLLATKTLKTLSILNKKVYNVKDLDRAKENAGASQVVCVNCDEACTFIKIIFS